MPHRNHPEGELASRRFERILIVKPSSLGDVVHALPLLDGLRRRYPDAKIDWIIGTPFAPLLEDHPQLDELIEFDRRRFGRLWRSPATARAFYRFIQSLRNNHYDLVIDLQGLFRTAFFAWASGTTTRIGFGDAREGAPMFYTHRLPGGSGDIHAVDRNLQVRDILGLPHEEAVFTLAIRESDRVLAARLLAPLGQPALHRIVAFVPGARWPTKRWSPKRFAETIDRMADSDNHCRCVLLGGSDEAALGRDIAARCQSRPLDLTGKTNLRELMALIERADLVVCQDSAAAHLAAALHRPLVCITGPTNPHRTGPYGRMEDVIRLDLDCSPCYLRRLSQCPHDHRCMTELSVDRVMEWIRRSQNETQWLSTNKAPAADE